jgi:hypothetical protein
LNFFIWEHFLCLNFFQVWAFWNFRNFYTEHFSVWNFSVLNDLIFWNLKFVRFWKLFAF